MGNSIVTNVKRLDSCYPKRYEYFTQSLLNMSELNISKLNISYLIRVVYIKVNYICFG